MTLGDVVRNEVNTAACLSMRLESFIGPRPKSLGVVVL